MSANYTFELDGKTINFPVEWQDIQIEATFVNETEGGEVSGSQQANITFEKFTFVNKAAKQIRDYILDGENGNGPGIFEGMTFKITGFDAFDNLVVFDGMLDLTDDYEEINAVKVECNIKRISGLNSFAERAQAISYGFLLDQGVITPADFVNIQYVVERKDQGIELVISAVSVFLLSKELAEAIKELGKNIANVVAIATGGSVIPPTGLPASFVLALTFALIQAAYTALIIIALIKMVEDFINRLVSPVRDHKGMLWRTLLSKGVGHLGLNFISPIPELDRVHFLPSGPDEEEPITEGIPKPSDFGYQIDEMISLAMECFNGKLAIIGNDIHLRSENDPFWEKTSTYEVPSVDVESKVFNTDDMRTNRIVKFLTDVNDQWTTNNFKGTNFEVITNPIQVVDPKKVLLKNLDQIQIQAALGNRKDKLTDLEKVLKSIAGIADGIVNFFGGKSNLSSRFNRKLGMLKVSNNVHSISKLIYLNQNLKLPVNHRDLWSAKLLYNKYINERSFVANNFGQQYQLFTNVKVPFSLEDFVSLIDNRFFRNFDGRKALADAIRFNLSKDRAFFDYRVRKIYTRNLQETFVEPE